MWFRHPDGNGVNKKINNMKNVNKQINGVGGTTTATAATAAAATAKIRRFLSIANIQGGLKNMITKMVQKVWGIVTKR